MIRKRRSRVRRYTLPEISLTPLVDTALNLLVVFMITTPIIQQGIEINLPHAQGKKQNDASQECVVSIQQNGAIFLNNLPVNKEDLTKVVAEMLEKQKKRVVHVKGDKSLSYQQVIEVINCLHQAKVEHIAMLVSPSLSC